MIRSPAGFDGADRIKRYLDYYQPSYGVMMLSAGQFSPALLFASGEQGVWYDPSDMTTLFQDATGTTPVTAVEQPVGLMLDKSQGLVLGSELATSPDLSWDASVAVDSAVLAPVVSGKWYRFEWAGLTTTATTGVNLRVVLSAISPNFPVNTSTATSGVIYFVAPTTGNLLVYAIQNANNIGSFSSVSVRELPGNHASQSTSASRPVLSARVNLFLNSATLSTQNVTTVATNYTLRFEGAGSVTLSGTGSGTYNAGTHTVTCTAGTLTVTVTGSVSNADIRVANIGVSLPAYQAITTATSYDTTGFPMYLRFDGTDDSMATATINPGSVDKTQVFAGMRNLLVSAGTNYGCVVEYSANLQTNNGVFTLFAPDGLGGIGYDYTWISKGTSASPARVQTPNYVAPRTTVTSGLGDVSGDSSILRLNGAQVSQSTTDQGTGNYLSYPLYIGRRGGSTLPFNGHLYSLIARFGANLPDATIAQTETWVNSKTGAY